MIPTENIFDLEFYNPADQLIFFGIDEDKGTNFCFSWSLGHYISKPSNTPFIYCNGVNEETLKKVQRVANDQTIDFENFLPKQNLKYRLFTYKNKAQFIYFEDELCSYEYVIQHAKRLADEGYIVIIAEETNKAKVLSKVSEIEDHPFSLANNTRHIFYYYSRSNIFSNVLTHDEINAISGKQLESSFPMGYATIFKSKRIAYFLNGEVHYFSQVDESDQSFTVFSRKKHIKDFNSFEDALHFCQTENDKGKYGTEFLIALLIERLNWH